MVRTILLVFLILPAILISYASGACFHVDRDDLLEYDCIGGHTTDLNAVPEGVEQLKISRMRIPIVTSHMFSRFGENLLVLRCSECEIRDIEANAFSRLTNLQQLSLDNNRITSLKASWLQGIKELNYLDLTYNQLEDIEDEAFEYLAGVSDLRLSGNRLKCLNLDAMARMENLKRMFMSENPYFQCPNAVSKFLENRQVAFQKDENWSSITQDLIPATRINQQDWRTRRPYVYPTTTTPAYRERLTDSRRHPTTETHWPTHLTTEHSTSSSTPWPEWPTTMESEIPRQDAFFNRGSSDNTQETYAPSTEKNSMTTEPTPPNWFTEIDPEYVPRSRPVETTYPTEYIHRTRPVETTYPTEYIDRSHSMETTYPTEDMSRPMLPVMPTEIIQSADPKGFQPYYVPQVTNPQMVENYRQLEATLRPVLAGTDKPLPDCPNSSSTISAMIKVTLLPVLFSISKNIFSDVL